MRITSKVITSTLAGLLAGIIYTGSALAAPVLCNDDGDATRNRMSIDDSQVSACLASGVGNLTGNPANDLFLNSAEGAGYTTASKSDDSNPYNLMFTQNNGSGTWSFDSSFWDDNDAGAIAFKFGTGNNPDEWFVYSLQDGVSSGDWSFLNVFARGGGLSHVTLYATSAVVSEPATLALLGLGLMGFAFTRRRAQRV
ncbi:PEP-CTERM sorting domain-containing protein [Marinobacter sp. SS21]|uniref:PEP-CTERM sorting domain-containing protein n=1 Tax=Marinobacter sp. SS21 TaxID=2979460 RepID=UPI00232B4C73|nr:PEP-CTERM sorting domain-containing protein [Marinobacter sp. SS21]MDC0663994.1 PEP-CTERM sorting domain-containing protein [Marinobacter sp. SS21]